MAGNSDGSAAPARGWSIRRLQAVYFTLEGLNSLAAAYYFNYLFFFMRDHFGFGNRENLAMTVVHGFFYTLSAAIAGRFAQRFGYLNALRVGFGGMGVALVVAAIIPRFMGFTRAALIAEFVALVVWTLTVCLTWPTLQALLSRGEKPAAMPRIAGIYNIVWSSCAAVAYLTGGALYERVGDSVIFWLPVGLHVLEFLILLALPKSESLARPVDEPVLAETEESEAVTEVNPRPIAKVRTFLYLAWLANPFAYIAIYGVLPAIPKLADQLGMSHTSAGIICSAWYWVRLASFVFLWVWPGWHYRFRWLLTAFIAMPLSFAGILLSPNVYMLLAAQLVFGLAVSLIYYSSLFYSMDEGASQGKRGGFHEAAIGLGIFCGPAVGASALFLVPAMQNASTLAISVVLVLGLIPFVWIKRRAV